MKNVRSIENVNPVTGEVSINKLFDTTLVSINKNMVKTTPNGKEYHIGNIETPQGNLSCRIPTCVQVNVGDEVTVSATQLEKITALSVIGLAQGSGNTAGASFFDTIGGTTETVAKTAVVAEESDF